MSPETSVNFYRTTRSVIPENDTLNSRRSGNVILKKRVFSNTLISAVYVTTVSDSQNI
jgi:hypothetical protein